MKIKDTVKVDYEKQEYPDKSIEDIKALVIKLNQEARENK